MSTTTPQRIAVVTETFHLAADGGTAATRHLVDELVRLGHDVIVLAPAPGLASYRGCEVVRVRTGERPGRQVRQELAEFGPDLVHVASPARLGRKALKHARKLGVPTVVVQTTPVTDLAAPAWQTRIAARADVLLTTSEWLLPQLERLGAHAAVWRPGADLDTFSPARRDERLHAHWSRVRRKDAARASGEQLTVVGYAGRLSQAHGIGRLVELADLPDLRLVVIGDGPDRRWLQKRLPAATFTGHLDSADLGRAVASLDVLVHPGEQESCCQPLRDAAASGVPVVAPRAGGAPEVVRHQETGLLCEPEDLRSLRRAVTNLAADPQRSDFAGPARALAEQRSWRTAVHELVTEHYPRACAAYSPDTLSCPA